MKQDYKRPMVRTVTMGVKSKRQGWSPWAIAVVLIGIASFALLAYIVLPYTDLGIGFRRRG